MNVMYREPTHPGLFLEEDYLKPLGITHDMAAYLLGVDKTTIESFIRKELPVSSTLAKRLEQVFKTEWTFWINAQRTYDKWMENQRY